MKSKLFNIVLILIIVIFAAIILSRHSSLFYILINFILSGTFLYIIYDYINSKLIMDNRSKQNNLNQNIKRVTNKNCNHNMNNRNMNNRNMNNRNMNNRNMNNHNMNNRNMNNSLNKNGYNYYNDYTNDQEISNLLNQINMENSNNPKNKNDEKYDYSIPDQTDKNKNGLNNNDTTPLYENLENLKYMNYYSGQGLNCAYDLQFSKDFSNFKDIYSLTGCNGDTKLANRMKFMSLKDKFAKENRAAFDRTSIQHLFTDELNIEEKRIWWENPDIYDSNM